DLVGDVARGKADAHGRQPGGTVCRRALLKEVLALDAVDIALEHDGPVGDAAHRALAHGQVIAHQVKLGDAGGGKIDLAGARDRDLAPCDLDDLGLFFACHCASVLHRYRHVRGRPAYATRVDSASASICSCSG